MFTGDIKVYDCTRRRSSASIVRRRADCDGDTTKSRCELNDKIWIVNSLLKPGHIFTVPLPTNLPNNLRHTILSHSNEPTPNLHNAACALQHAYRLSA